LRAERRTRAKKTHGRLGVLWTSIYTPAAYESPDPPMCTLTRYVPSENTIRKEIARESGQSVNVGEKDCTVLLDRLLSFPSLEARLSTTQKRYPPALLVDAERGAV